MARTTRFSKNRETIYDFLTRAKRYHATSTSIHELDVTELMARLDRRRAAGRPVGFLATFVKATAMVLARYPRLNRHLFHGPLGKYEVEFDQIVCTLIVLRKHQRELILLPLNIEAPDQLSIDEIDAQIRHHRKAPLDELASFRGIQQLKKLPRPALRLWSYLCRSNHRVYRKFFGTYGVSPLLVENDDGLVENQPGCPTSAFANTCVAFFPATVSDQARVVDGDIAIRKILTLMFAVDHYLVDGHDGFMAIRYLAKLVEEPDRLGLSDGADRP
jgi:pyruvate/2-oxoglutarate dehydrogenase complex dihydrolipoamide acyltransferase (E2) component